MASTGVVKFFNTAKGFGFIIPDGPAGAPTKPEVYFNRASLPRARAYDPVEGDSVAYQERKSDKGIMAVRVELL